MASRSHWPERVALIAAAACVLLGAAVLVGWSIHSIFLIEIKPTLPPMQRMSALSFMFCGLALGFLLVERPRAAAICSAVPLLIAVAVALEYIFETDFGIDQLLGPGYITVLAPYPGRMSQLTMTALLLLSSTLAAASFPPLRARVSSMLGVVGAVVFTVGLVSGLSYAIAARETYAWGHILRVALQTRIALVLSGMGLLGLAWKESERTSLYPKWLPLSVWLSISVSVLGLWQAFILNEGRTYVALSHSLLIGGLIIAALFGLTAYLAQQASDRNLALMVYRMAIENSLDGIILASLDGTILAANPSACRILDRTEKEIRHDWRGGLSDESDPGFRRLLDQRKRTGKAEGEILGRRKDGSLFPMEVSSVLFKDPLGQVRTSSSIRDISERKRAESELKLQTERLSLATRAASIGVWDLDVRTQQAIWDDTLFEMFGLPRQVPMPYEAWSSTVHPDDLPAAEASLKRVIELKTQDACEFRIIRPDGKLRHIASTQGAVLDDQQRVVRIVGVEIDISERKKMEEQLAASARLSALSVMAGGMAHEVNNPLAIIHASAGNLLDTLHTQGKVEAEEVARNASRIQQTTGRIAKIITSLRRIAREESQDAFLPVPVSRIAEETLEICRERFQAHSVELRLPAIDPQLTIFCREAQIAQVLHNLLLNAFDAVADQPKEKWVQLSVGNLGAWVVLSIVDSGPGIPMEIRSRIMEPFFTTKEVGKGMGLGLSLSRTIAEEHGGKLEFIEDRGHTCFRLSLPVPKRVNAYAA